jgi:CBS domain-containing protein
MAILSDKKISGAPLIDEHGKPVGVISLSDIATYVAGLRGSEQPLGDFHCLTRDAFPQSSESLLISITDEIPLDDTKSCDIMTLEIISVKSDIPVSEAAEKMWQERIHRVLVEDGGVLLGVISTMDILQVAARNHPAQTSP